VKSYNKTVGAARNSLFTTVEAVTQCSNCRTCWTTVSVSLNTSEIRR
jgi:hypothetical protein